MDKRLILLIETATTCCSVALALDGNVIAFKEVNERNIHASHITLFIEDVMQKASKKYKDIDAIAVSKGPGSYTGLRIGVSTAKGLCYSLDVPLISIDTLQAMADGLIRKSKIDPSALLIPMIDARRMEVYTGIYRTDLRVIEDVNAKIVDHHSFDQFGDSEMILFGDGSEKFRDLFSGTSTIRFETFENSATHLASLADEKFIHNKVEDMAYFEPFYLKDFVAKSGS